MKNEKKETRGRKRGEYYVENDELVKGVRQFYETGEFSRELGLNIKKVVDGVSKLPKVINYFKEDNPWGKEMYSDAIWRITKSIYDRTIKLVDDDLIGTIEKDADGNVVYKIDKDGNYVLDEKGDKIPNVITQNNLFGYFSVTAWNAFIGRKKKEAKDSKKLEEYKDKVFEEYELEYGIQHQSEGKFRSENDW